jgi:cytoskeletal protein RodZ
MALFSRSNASSELPGSQIEYNNNEGGKRWVVLIVYIVLALVVATLVVFAGRWVYHKVSNNSEPTPTTIAPQGVNQGSKSAPNSASPTSPSTSPAPGASPTPTSGTTPVPSGSPSGKSATPTPAPTPSTNKSGNVGKTTPTPTPTSLPNNGPGEDIAIFLGVTFAAASLHFIVSLRKTARNI